MNRTDTSLYRNGLWYKLIKSGINGRLLKIIRSMYDEVKLCVRHMGTLSDFFNCEVGLLQGETISPILFSLFANDIELFLSNNNENMIALDQLSIYLLLFADDAVIFSETQKGLQKSLDNLYEYFERWKLKVNVEKTKVVIYKKGEKKINE